MSHGKNDYIIKENIERGLYLDKQSKIVLASGKPYSGDTVQQNGYLMVWLTGNDGKGTAFQVARVICWLTYGPPPFKGAVVDHRNRCKTDNRPSNLRWSTHSDNILNVSRDGRYHQLEALKKGQLLKGSDVGNSKITEEIVKEIFKLRSQALPQKDIASKFNISRCHVTDILNRKRWGWVIIPKEHLVNKNAQHKLSEDDIWRIERLLRIGKMKQKDIAKKFDIAPSVITKIKKRMVKELI